MVKKHFGLPVSNVGGSQTTRTTYSCDDHCPIVPADDLADVASRPHAESDANPGEAEKDAVNGQGDEGRRVGAQVFRLPFGHILWLRYRRHVDDGETSMRRLEAGLTTAVQAGVI